MTHPTFDREALLARAREAAATAGDANALAQARAIFFGRKGGVINDLMKATGALPPAERPAYGQAVNNLRDEIAALFDQADAEVAARAQHARLLRETVDVTLPGRPHRSAPLHPLTRTQNDLLAIFARLGFTVRRGPEAELEKYNFEDLNFPPDHPARDMQDTFFIKPGVVLRTHTSPVQVRTMLREDPPVQVVAPGAVYRCDSDITHSPMFFQVEGLMIDEDITFGDLKGVLWQFAREFYGPGTAVRFRASFFPFTEPSAEMDVRCVFCQGAGCRVCKQSGWLEILGCGMVNPKVLENVNYDPERYQGFAFGMGVERIAMLRYGISDIRLFYDNDLRFLGAQR